MLRRGAVRALDLDDYHPGDRCLDVRHRPETGTPIENQEDGERMVALLQGLCDLLDYARSDVTDVHDHEPLISGVSPVP